MNAATDLFAARGYGAVSMDAIARAADVSKATLYAHFESKDRLFATIVHVACLENMMPAEDLPDDRACGEASIEEMLRTIGGGILRFLLLDRSLAIHRLVIAESVRFPELGRAFHENGPVAGRTRLAAWMASRPGLDVPDPDVAAEQFFALLRSGLYLRATLGLPPAPDDAAIEAVVTAAVGTFLRAYGS